MIAAERVAVVLLAAGLSRRFGEGDKLASPLGDLALGLHAARTLARLPFAARIAVTRANGPPFGAYGFAAVVNADPGRGQSGSIRLGVAGARPCRPAAVLIALADMPFVTVRHLRALLDRFDAEHPVVASTGGEGAGPPALFDASLLDRLEALEGDAGARALLRHATLVAAPAPELADIDTPADLATALARGVAPT